MRIANQFWKIVNKQLRNVNKFLKIEKKCRLSNTFWLYLHGVKHTLFQCYSHIILKFFQMAHPIPWNWTMWRLGISLPLWFYVKSILADFKRSKTVILTWFLEKISHLQISKNSKFRAVRMVKIAVFDLLKSVRIDIT